MSSGSALARNPGEPARLSADVRLSVEQVSYAYSANPAQAPDRYAENIPAAG